MKKKLQRCWGYALCCIVLSASVYASIPICIPPFAAHIIRCANTSEEKKTSILEVEKSLRQKKPSGPELGTTTRPAKFFLGFALFLLQRRNFSLLKKAAHSQNVRWWWRRTAGRACFHR